MNPRLLDCPDCRRPLPLELANTGRWEPCPQCGQSLHWEVFPAAGQTPSPGAPADPVLVEGEAACFYHPEKRAVVPCNGCGRFLCGLCEIPFGEEHLCANCLRAAQEKDRRVDLENKRTLYDGMALAAAVLPLLIFPFWFLTLLTAPLAIGIGIYSFWQPNSLVRRTRLRAWLAIGLGIMQLGGWAYFIVASLGGAFL